MIQLSHDRYRIEIADEQARTCDSKQLIAAVSMILNDHHIDSAEISIALVDDPTIREINNSYLGHDYETDVISFLLDYDSDREYLSGQLIVSTDTAATVATELKIPMDHEILLYVIHGTLHLVGLDDTSQELADEMRVAERHYLSFLGVDYRWPEDIAGDGI